MNVFHFFLDHRRGGPHEYFLQLRAVLPKTISMKAITPGNGDITDISIYNLRQISRYFYPIEILINSILLTIFFIKLSKRNDVIFHIHGALNIAPIIASFILNIPLVWHIHETVSKYKFIVKVIIFLLGNYNYKLATVSYKAVRVYGLTNFQVHSPFLIESFWDPNRFNQINLINSHNKFNSSGSYMRILAVGNLNPLKGFDLLLDALIKCSFSFQLCVIGSQLFTHKEYSKLLFLKSKNIDLISVDNKVNFLGKCESTVVRQKLSSCDVYVLSSRSEAFPISLLEAIGMGVPCIATNVGDSKLMLDGFDLPHFICEPTTESLLKSLESFYILWKNGLNGYQRKPFYLSDSKDEAMRLIETYLTLNRGGV